MTIASEGARSDGASRSAWAPARRLGPLAVALAIVALASPAQAEPALLRIDYSAPPGCPDASAFVDEILFRTSLARIAAPADEAALVRAWVVQRSVGSAERSRAAPGERADMSIGRLVLVRGGERIDREIHGATCDEVVAALGLVVALAIDPHASTAARAARTPAPAPPPPRAPPPPATPPVFARAPDLLATPLPVLLADGDPPRSDPRRRWLAGARASSGFGVTPWPHPLLGAAVFAGIVLDEATSASLRLAADFSGTGSFAAGAGGAAFFRAEARLDGCMFSLQRQRVSIVPCVAVEAGALQAKGVHQGSLTTLAGGTVPWLSAGLVPRLDVDLGAVAIELQGGPLFPFVRQTFVFESPESVVYQLPAVTGSVTLGARVSFP